MKKIYMFILSACFISAAAAQDSVDDSTAVSKERELGEVVVTGQYKPQSVKNSVYQVRVITKERIQRQGAIKLQDVLNNELNIRFSQDPSLGGSDITMLGLPGQSVKILLDGLPLIGRQGTSNEININQIDVNTIERIEIVEGPMSVVYGSDALAGVINIITKKAGPSSLSVTARLQEETVGKEYGVKGGIHQQNAGLSWRYKKWEIGGNFGYNYFGGWQGDSTNRELAWHWKDQITGSAYVGFTTSRFNIRYRFDGLDEIITNPGNFTSYVPEADDWYAQDQEYLSRRAMHQLQTGYFVNSKLSFQAQASYTDYSRQTFTTQVSQKTGAVTMSPAAGVQSKVEFQGVTIRASSLIQPLSYLSFQPGIDINLESGEGERLADGTSRVNDIAGYLTAELKISRFQLRPGIRVINNSVYDAPPVIPSVNVKVGLTDKIDFRGAYARGFRAPTLRELYFNFFDANHQIIGNPDLKAETSNSYTASFEMRSTTAQGIKLTTTVSGFYNEVKNLIDFALNPNNNNQFMLVNVSNSKTAGASISNTINHKNLTFTLGASYTGFYNVYSESVKSEDALLWSPEVNSIIGYTFSRIGLDANLFYKFTGRRLQPTLNSNDEVIMSRQEAYHNADITVNKKLFKLFTITAGVRNLFDVVNLRNSTPASGGAHTSSVSRVIGYGRSYFAGLQFNWNKK
jgi:outer membrane receptor for ferrienterochelin and colicins